MLSNDISTSASQALLSLTCSLQFQSWEHLLDPCHWPPANRVSIKHSLLYLTARRKSHNNSDKVEVLTTPKGATTPLGPILPRLHTAPLMICLGWLWFHSDCSLQSWFNHTTNRNSRRINNIFFLPRLQKKSLSKSTEGLQRGVVRNTI